MGGWAQQHVASASREQSNSCCVCFEDERAHTRPPAGRLPVTLLKLAPGRLIASRELRKGEFELITGGATDAGVC